MIWFYSHKLKRILFVGNIVSSLLSVIPFLIILIYYKNFELIICDQTDIIQEEFYEGWSLNIKLIKQKEKALWLARNKSIQMADGEIIILTEDDVINAIDETLYVIEQDRWQNLGSAIAQVALGKKIDELGGTEAIEEARTQVEWCFLKYKDEYSNNMRKLITKLTNVPPRFDIFELRFTIEQQRDIYKENRQMRINNTIRKVIFEQNEKKQSLIAETKIIKNRLGYIVENSNKYNLKNNLLKAL